VWQIRLATATTHTEEDSHTRSSGYLFSRCRILLVLVPCDQFAWQMPRSAGSDSEKDNAAPNLAILARGHAQAKDDGTNRTASPSLLGTWLPRETLAKVRRETQT
jgi:hypothetical protein